MPSRRERVRRFMDQARRAKSERQKAVDGAMAQDEAKESEIRQWVEDNYQPKILP